MEEIIVNNSDKIINNDIKISGGNSTKIIYYIEYRYGVGNNVFFSSITKRVYTYTKNIIEASYPQTMFLCILQLLFINQMFFQLSRTDTFLLRAEPSFLRAEK